MYQPFQTTSHPKIAVCSGTGQSSAVHISTPIALKGRNIDLDEFLKFVVAISQGRHGWIASNILFRDVEDFARLNGIPLENSLSAEEGECRVKTLRRDIKTFLIPRLKELYPEKMESLLQQEKKVKRHAPSILMTSPLKSSEVSIQQQVDAKQIKILDRILLGDVDLSSEEEKAIAVFGINLADLRLNTPDSEPYQEQIIRVRQKLAFLKMKFHT